MTQRHRIAAANEPTPAAIETNPAAIAGRTKTFGMRVENNVTIGVIRLARPKAAIATPAPIIRNAAPMPNKPGTTTNPTVSINLAITTIATINKPIANTAPTICPPSKPANAPTSCATPRAATAIPAPTKNIAAPNFIREVPPLFAAAATRRMPWAKLLAMLLPTSAIGFFIALMGWRIIVAVLMNNAPIATNVFTPITIAAIAKTTPDKCQKISGVYCVYGGLGISD